MYTTFLQEFQKMSVVDKMEEFIATLDSDHSEWVCIDGEEGDYGVIVYRFQGLEVCRMISEGGDSDYYKFTPAGKTLLLTKLLEVSDIDKELSSALMRGPLATLDALTHS